MSNYGHGGSFSGGGWDRSRGNGGDDRRGARSYEGGTYRGPDRRDQDRNYDDRRKNNYGGRGGHGYENRSNSNAKHMGELTSIEHVLKAREFSDASCLEIIAPRDTDRESRVLGPDSNQARSHVVLQPWRLETPAGLQLGDEHVLRSNFFRVQVSGIPETVFHYNVSIFRYKRSADDLPTLGDDPEDLAAKSDKFLTTSVMRAALANLDQRWQEIGVSFGIAYDGGSSVYTTRKLPFPSVADPAGPLDDAYELNHMYQQDVGSASRPQYAVVLRYVKAIAIPRHAWAGNPATAVATTTMAATGAAGGLLDHREALQAMDVALLAFARRNLEDGRWFLSGNTIFSAKDSKTYPLNSYFEGRLGYHASFRSTLSGLALVKDISVTCFLRGGSLLMFMTAALGCREHELARALSARDNRKVDHLLALLKNCSVRVTHLGMRKKFRGLGPAANDPDSAFSAGDEQPARTVAEYYHARYEIPLRYPALPTVDVGTRQRPILVPMELLEIVAGQTRQRSITGDVSAQIIKHAAMKPNDRFRALTQGSFLFPALQADVDAQHFGLANLVGTGAAEGGSSSSSRGPAAAADGLPMRVLGTILPPAKLQYGEGRVLEPKLRGAWNLAGGHRFARPAEAPDRRSIAFGTLAVCAHEGEFERGYNALNTIIPKLEGESRKLGVPMNHSDRVRVVVHQPWGAGEEDLKEVLGAFKELGVRIVVVLLMEESFYARVKYLADGLCLLTQCMRYSVVSKMPRNYETSLLIKMNAKMGGTNHTLASRAPRAEDDGVFQQPPKSISWVFDVPAMVIGIDVSHPEPHCGFGAGADSSVVAVVASMDGMLSQYCAHISSCSASREPVSSLHDSFVRLIQVFCKRNRGQFPEHIIVYRDGVADSQFTSTLDSELMALQQAIEHFNKDEDMVKIAFVVCQKRHHTRFFYKPADGGDYLNPCVGLCVDARGFAGDSRGDSERPRHDAPGCVVGSGPVEFYLNSHAAVLGTSKPTRYVLLHDGIGFKLSELELLTFWLTHLYARCTRSVSIVAPAYYAHWAARRGRVLLTGSGGEINSAALKTMSGNWLDCPETNGMYFI